MAIYMDSTTTHVSADSTAARADDGISLDSEE